MADAATAKAVFDKVMEALGHARLVSHFDALNTTLLAYDVVLNLPLEIKHIWTKQWSFLTIIYIIQRYLPFFDTAGVALHINFGVGMSPKSCTSSYKTAAWSFFGGVMLSEILLTLRVWAVWERLADFPFPVPSFRGCFVAGGSHILYLCWVLWMVYDTDRRGGRSELIKAVYQDVYLILGPSPVVSTLNVVVVLRLSTDQPLRLDRSRSSFIIIRARTALSFDKSRNSPYSSDWLATLGCPDDIIAIRRNSDVDRSDTGLRVNQY
ncbi:hypothetical protein L218DRAFT_947611 [Marasmius fiardii PR-910]|nr:hypothetical protein L218DRAFT_947611 [Marasmius fiardii PR-910]